MEFDTIAVQGGISAKEHKNVISPPIYQNTAFSFDNVDYAADLFDLKCAGDIYTRISNPTTEVLEKRVAMLEGGVGALCVSSGQSASLLSVLNIASYGDEIVASANLYGGTVNLFSHTLKRLGIKTNFVASDDIDDYKKAINEKTKCIFVESLGNPKLNVSDIEGLAKIAHGSGIPLVVDNTVATPYLLKPFEWGADIIIHSTTKYMSGHGNALGGVIVDSGNFDWAKSGKFASLVEPDESYHGLSYVNEFKNAAYIVKARAQLLRDFGTTISPFNAYLTLLGLETLHLRMERCSKSAMEIAKYLSRHEKIAWVNYPMLESSKYFSLAEKYLKGGSSIVSFGIKGGRVEGTKFIENLKLCIHATNIGDSRTIMTYPALTTHRQLSDEEKRVCGIGDDFMRVSVGLESAADIIRDIENAIAKI